LIAAPLARLNAIRIPLLLFGLVVIGAALRLPLLNLPGPQGDEVYMPWLALKVLNHQPIYLPKIHLLGHDLPLTLME